MALQVIEVVWDMEALGIGDRHYGSILLLGLLA
jgi:hypothetical protein